MSFPSQCSTTYMSFRGSIENDDIFLNDTHSLLQNSELLLQPTNNEILHYRDPWSTSNTHHQRYMFVPQQGLNQDIIAQRQIEYVPAIDFQTSDRLDSKSSLLDELTTPSHYLNESSTLNPSPIFLDSSELRHLPNGTNPNWLTNSQLATNPHHTQHLLNGRTSKLTFQSKPLTELSVVKPKTSKKKKCQVDGCTMVAQSKGCCRAHGGGQRCRHPGCSKSSQGRGFCIAHGGGKRCAVVGCTKSAQTSNFCARHGGIKQCEVNGCTRNVRSGGKCAYHGGRRCSAGNNCKRLCRANGLCERHRHVKKELTPNV